MPTALDITIAETLELLNSHLREFADGVCDDRYAVWLGAGISLSKLPGLPGVAEAVLEHVRGNIDHGNPNCSFRTSLDSILALVTLSDAQRTSVDYTMRVSSWIAIREIKHQLVSRYGTMLDQFPTTERPDYLVWNGIEVVERYADPATTPGPEHLGLAALIMEGAASDSASANWDDLIEKAMQILDGPATSVLQVRILPTDVQDNVRRARIYKFHGCAALAGRDETRYRDKIVARESQIHGWAHKAENQVIAAKLLDLAISKPTLMLGLSAQDTNIQEVFVKAQARLPASFPTHPPAVVVSENQVGAHQRSLLQNFYRNDYPLQSAQIHAASLVRSYARSLLPALWLYVLCAKLSAMIDKAVYNLPLEDRDALRLGLRQLGKLAASAVRASEHEDFMLRALATCGRLLGLFHRGRVRTPIEGLYAPFTDVGLSRSLTDPHLDSSGRIELSLALALVGYGELLNHWHCSTSDPSDLKTGALRLSTSNNDSEVFFAASAHAAAQLFAQGHVADDDKAILVHSFEVPYRASRHPTRPPGRTGKVMLREFSIHSIADGEVCLDSLLKQFRAEIAL